MTRTHHWILLSVCLLQAFCLGQDAETPAAPEAPFTPAVWLDPKVPGDCDAFERQIEFIERVVKVWECMMGPGYFEEARGWFRALDLRARVHGYPAWARCEALFGEAAALLCLGETDLGMARLEAAAAAGYADPFSFHEVIPRELWQDPRVAAVYGSMQLSPHDLHELLWLRAELSAVQHDATMMTTHNIGRKDDGTTQLAHVDVPNRPTSSPTVAGYRLTLIYLQRWQANVVMQSDQARVSHLVNMEIIENMGTPRDPGLKLQEVQRSRLAAAERDRVHLATIEARQYVAPAGADGAPQPLPDLGSLELEQQIAAPAERPRLEGAQALQPAHADQAESWHRFVMTTWLGGELSAQQDGLSWTTAVDGEQLCSVTVLRGGEATRVEDWGGFLRRTQGEQMLSELSVYGGVTAVGYEERDSEREFAGQTVPVKECELVVDWNSGLGSARWAYLLILAPELRPGGLVLETRLVTEGFELRTQTTDFGFGE